MQFARLINTAIAADHSGCRGLTYGQQVLAAVLEELMGYIWNGQRDWMEAVLEATGLYEAMETTNLPTFSSEYFHIPTDADSMGQVELQSLFENAEDAGRLYVTKQMHKLCPLVGTTNNQQRHTLTSPSLQLSRTQSLATIESPGGR